MKISNTTIFGNLLSDCNLCMPTHSKLDASSILRLNELKNLLLQAIAQPTDMFVLASLKDGLESMFWWEDVAKLLKALHYGLQRPQCEAEGDHIGVIRDWYQILSFLGKIKRTHTHEQEKQYITKFLSNEESCKNWTITRRNTVNRLAIRVLRHATRNLDLSAEAAKPHLRHGPGAVLEYETGSDKNVFVDPPQDLALSYPIDTFFANAFWTADYARCFGYDRSSRHVKCRLALVPKDIKGPRGVFVSPKEVMLVQKAQDTLLKLNVQRSWMKHCWDPNSQVPSQKMALEGSTGGYATLDLSDASDRIPLSLVSKLFHRKDYLNLARSRPSFCMLPDGTYKKMRMFSPMGDGKTFAVLTYIAASITIAAMLERDGIDLSLVGTCKLTDCGCSRDASCRKAGYCYEHSLSAVLAKYAKRIRVFGDDIIVPSEYYESVCDALEMHNLKVNKSKSFSTGWFREACGMDAYFGTCITPLKLRVDLDRLGQNDDEFVKLVALHNYAVMFYPRLKKTIAYVRSVIEDRYPLVAYAEKGDTAFPTRLWVTRDEVEMWSRKTVLGFAKNSIRCRFNDALQHVEVLTYACTNVDESLLTSLDPWWDLNYWLLTHPNDENRIPSVIDGNFAQVCTPLTGSTDDPVDWELSNISFKSITFDYQKFWDRPRVRRGSKIAEKRYLSLLPRSARRALEKRKERVPLSWQTLIGLK